MNTSRKSILTILAGAALLTAPLAVPSAALAQSHGGGHSSGGHVGGGGFRGGGAYHGAGFRGGYRVGYRGGYGYGYGAALGLGLGLAYAPYYDDYAYDPGPPVAYAPAYGYATPPCGQWLWNTQTGRYDWVAAACPAPQ